MKTPIQQLHYPNEKGIRIFCKRDDLLPFSLGGNKVRIGQELFKDMKEKGGNCMLAYGSPRSNLCRVLANLCYQEKIPCYMICSINENEDEAEVTNNSRLIAWLGAKVIFCKNNNVAPTVEATMVMLQKRGYCPYYIYGDKFGKGNEGTTVQAYVDCYREIEQWEKNNGVSLSHIFFASGTGATQSGLVTGKLLDGGHENIVGISISSREYARAIEIMENSIREYCKKNNINQSWKIRENLTLDISCRAGGYGVYNDEILKTVHRQFCTNGLPLDTTYTGKAFWGMTNYIEKNKLYDCDVLFLHTGGTPLFYDCLMGGTK